MDANKTRSKHSANNHIEHDNHVPPVKEANKVYGLPSLDLAFDLTKERMSGQLARIDGLDNKANFIKGAATGIVGLALTLQTALFSAPATSSYCTSYIPSFLHTLNPLLKRAIPLIPLIITYVIVMYLSHLAYKIDNYHEVPTNPEALYDYLAEDVAITKIDIYNRMRVHFQQNELKIRSKARWATYAFRFLEVEGLSLVLLLLYRSIC
jgi:hypothetical protein